MPRTATKYRTMIARSTVERVINCACSSSAGENSCNRLHLHIVWDLNFRVKDA